jgi:hypothetical protein
MAYTKYLVLYFVVLLKVAIESNGVASILVLELVTLSCMFIIAKKLFFIYLLHIFLHDASIY